MYKSLLVPLDGSGFSARTLPLGVALARRCDATLHLAMVLDPSAFMPFVPGEVAVPIFDASLLKQQRDEAQRALDDAVASVVDQGVRAVGVLLEGTVVERLVEYGQEVAAELTIMTTHGRGGFARFRLGSVATGYLVQATQPVLLIHGAGVEQPEAVAAATGAAALAVAANSALPSGALLVPLDGSPFGERIVPHAARFAEACGMHLELFGVVTPQSVSMAPFGMESLLADPDSIERDEHDRLAYLQRVASTCPEGTSVRCVSDMSAGEAVLNACTDAGAIAMATHGRSGIARLVLGSVTDEVIRKATIPVLVYRPDPVA